MSPDYSITIPPSDVVRDLGVYVNYNWSYNEHVKIVYSKAKQRINMLLRTFMCRTVEFMRFCWKTYIQPILDYCSQVWGPTGGSQLLKLESLLRSFSAKVDGLKGLHYWERLKILKLFSISRRQERYRILYSYKILHNLTLNCGLT